MIQEEIDKLDNELEHMVIRNSCVVLHALSVNSGVINDEKKDRFYSKSKSLCRIDIDNTSIYKVSFSVRSSGITLFWICYNKVKEIKHSSYTKTTRERLIEITRDIKLEEILGI